MFTRQSHHQTFASNIKDFQVRMYDAITFPKTNILATIGPASFNQIKITLKTPATDRISEMVEAGMNLIRVNLAHVKDQQDKQNICSLIRRVQEIIKDTKRAVGISFDLAGPKFRLGNLHPVEIAEGVEFTLTLDPNHGVAEGTFGDGQRCSLDVEPDFLIYNIAPGQRVLIDDGSLSLVVREVKGNDILCEAKTRWTLLAKKGVNFPGCMLTKCALTEKDRRDLKWLFDETEGIAKEGQVDFVSISFVKTASEVQDLRALLRFLKQEHVMLIAKIETTEAVDRKNDYRGFDRILEVADGIMVARGDLGAELGIMEVPEVQKELITRANKARKCTIVATQMLETMTKNRFPTRAEVTDVSNAIREGADTVMLSGETSGGVDPAGVVRMMASIARSTERWVSPVGEDFRGEIGDDFTQAIGHPIVEWAAHIDAKLIVVYTTTGYTAKMISHYRPRQPIVAITHNYDAIMELNLYWGIYSVLINYVPNNAEEAKKIVSDVIGQREYAKPGDVIIMTMSMGRLGVRETRDTNTIHVFRYDPGI